MQTFAVDEEGGADILLPEGVQHLLRALVRPVVKCEEERGRLTPGTGLELGQGLGRSAVHSLRPVTLVRH